MPFRTKHWLSRQRSRLPRPSFTNKGEESIARWCPGCRHSSWMRDALQHGRSGQGFQRCETEPAYPRSLAAAPLGASAPRLRRNFAIRPKLLSSLVNSSSHFNLGIRMLEHRGPSFAHWTRSELHPSSFQPGQSRFSARSGDGCAGCYTYSSTAERIAA